MCAHDSLWGPWISTTINNSNGIPIGLRTIRHEAFEVGLLHAIFLHRFIEISPHDTLYLCVLRLHVTYGNRLHRTHGTPLWSTLGHA
jgi:hypothetical protein